MFVTRSQQSIRNSLNWKQKAFLNENGLKCNTSVMSNLTVYEKKKNLRRHLCLLKATKFLVEAGCFRLFKSFQPHVLNFIRENNNIKLLLLGYKLSIITVRPIKNGNIKRATKIFLVTYECAVLPVFLTVFFRAETDIVFNLFLNFEKNKCRVLKEL